MGKKYLIVEIEDRPSSTDDMEGLSFFLFLGCIAFPPLIAILSIARGSCFRTKSGYALAAYISAIVIGIIVSLVFTIISFTDTYWVEDVGRYASALMVTLLVMFLTDLVTSLAFMRKKCNETLSKVLIFIVCAMFAAGILTTILLGVL